jgi:alpha-D-xyloside xylohydrolase
MGPTMEWSTEKPADPIELRVYPGADGDFTFYEDENDNYDYVRGEHATIKLHWDDATKTLTLGAREGNFPGMLQKHTFNVVVVGDGKGVGIGDGAAMVHAVVYQGDRMEAKF